MPARLHDLTADIELTDGEYREIADFVYKTSGINLLDGKKELMRARLAKRIRQLKFPNFRTYFKYAVSDSTGEETIFLLDAMATNLTSFFREPQHFNFLAKTLLPQWEAQRKEKRSHRLRIWSAACSTGEEPYTIAMVVAENSPYFTRGGDFKILATDLSTKVLTVAKKGVYGPEHVKTIPKPTLMKFFHKSASQTGAPMFHIDGELQHLILFKRFNLMHSPPFKGPVDLIFCRNVMIYFDRETIAALIDRFYNVLEHGGYLFIGHSESLSGQNHKFKYVAPCIYRKE